VTRADVSQLILDFGPPPAADFDNFVPGSNGECLAALRALPAQLRDGIDPPSRFVYVWGPPGSGKSHLATALTAHDVAQLVVVDDCHRLPAEAQRQLFHRFDAIAQSQDLALVTFGDAPPARLALMPELASRLAWGMVFALEPLGDDDLVAAVAGAAQERGLALDPGLPAYLLTHTRRDIGSLKTLIASLDRLSLQQKRPVTLPMLRSLLTGAAADPAADPAAGSADRMTR
jgi:DnaA-homolog protein